jgi:hypothetical protein
MDNIPQLRPSLKVIPTASDTKPTVSIEVGSLAAVLDLQDVENLITILQEWREAQCLLGTCKPTRAGKK